MRFPFNFLMKPLGGIGIDRTPRSAGNQRLSFVEVMTNLFNQHEDLIIVITPEGTRSKREKWKTGFYHIAQAAHVPILMGYVDYKTKTTGITTLLSTGHYETDMKTIMAFYKTIHPKYPENFSVDKEFE